MAIFLRLQVQNFKSYSIKKAKSYSMKMLASVFFLASLFFCKETYASSFSFSGGTLVASKTSFCAGDSATLTFTATSSATVAGPWSATYQWDSSSNGGLTWVPVTGATGTLTYPSPVTTTLNTSGLFVTTVYRIRLTGITASLVGANYTSSSVTLTVNPLPATITGNNNICLGATSCLTDATAGGTWSSTNTAVATVGTSGCVFGVTTGTASIIYTIGTGCATLTTVTVNATAPITGPSAVCVGGTITLTDATAGVSWNSSNTLIATIGSTTGIVTGVAPGATTIIATSPLGCIAITTITVNPNPTAITGNANICIGSTNCLTDATGGGTWSSSNNGVATVGSSGCVFGAATGTATISYTLATGCYAINTVTINPLPAAITGTASVCVGLTTSLTDATAGGTWGSSNPGVATVSGTGVVTGVTPGTTIINYTSAVGCITSVTVTVNPLAPITGNLNVCIGSTTTLSDAATGGIWSSSNGAVATVGSGSGVVSSVSLGTATIIYTLPFGCTASAIITVDPLPSAITGANVVCEGASITLSDVDAGGTWGSSTTTVAIAGSTTGTVTGISSGTTTITYTLPTGCNTTYVVSVNPVSPISGSMAVCVGSTSCLTDATGGGTWTSSNTAVGTVGTTGCVTGISAGTTIISYALPSGCTATTVVTVNPLPNPITGTLSVCAWGGTTQLTDASGGGVWSSTLVIVDLTGLVTGYDTGVGTVSYTLPTGCSVTASVTVNPLPNPITGNTTVCVGLTTTLSDGTAGGTWSSSNGAVAIVGAGTGVVTGISAAAGGSTATITYTLPTGCTADTTVLVEPLAAPITGVGTVCIGFTTALTDATSGGTWSSGNMAVGTVNSTGVVTGITAGTATIIYTLPTGCVVTSIVTVNPLPTAINGTMAVCMGSVTTLTDATGGGNWSSSNAAVGSVDATGDVLGIAPGTTTISYTLGTGCYTTATVTVNPLYPISGTATVCYNSSTSLSDAAGGGTWSSSDITIAIVGSSGIVTGTGAAGGTATITYTLPTGCKTNIIVTDNPLPSNITGVMTVCAGQTTALTDADAGGNWSSSNSGVATVGATGIVTGVSAALAGSTVTITYTLGTGCYTTATVTVNPLAPITGSATVCMGLITSLSDAIPGGTWSSSNSGIAVVDGSGNVSGVAAGTATISYILPTGCTATTTVTVYPFGPIVGGNTGLCVGFSITLTDAAAGGLWSSSNTGVATVGSISGTVTGVAAGTTIISYSLPGGCTATTIITVNSLAAITGPSNVCQGSTITLSDITTGGIWSSSNTPVGTVGSTTGVVGGVSSGTTIISYSYGPNCWAIYPVIVNPVNPISGTTTICPGLTTTLTDATGGGTWSSSNTTVASVGAPSSGVITGNSAGTATIIYALPTGCIATTTVTVDIVYPITGNTSLCVGTTSALTDITAGGTWSSSNTVVATVGSTGIVTSLTIGTSNITFTQPDGCIAVVTVTVNPLPAPITGPTQVCAWGGTITLTDATAGGAWSSTLVLIDGSGDVTAQDTGVATITYQLGTSCEVYYSVTVNPLPDNINGTLAICQGLTTTLSDPATPGGTWTSSNTGVATIGLATGFVNGVSPGSTMITYTLPTGCLRDTLLTVNPNPAPISGITSVCFGLTTTLTDATIGGSWSSSNTAIGSVGSSTGIVTGTGAAGGTVTITYTLNTGCINTIVVTVNPLPTAILGANTVCVGQTITLTDATAGGTWSSSNTGIAIIGSSTGVVTGVSQGVVTITYELSTGCIATTTITVNPLSPITGNPTLCIGLTTNLTDATAGGTWSSSNGAVASIGSTGIVTGITAGTSIISYVLPTGCTATVVVTVNALPTAILGTLSVCVGQTTSLSDGTAGGTWTSSNTGVATIGTSSGIVTGISAGTSIITYTMGSGCIVTAIVTVNPLAPISGPTSLCQSDTYAFTDAVGGGTWSSSNTAVASVDPFGFVTGTGVGTATISYIISGTGCTATLTVTVSALGPINGSTDLCVGVTTIFTDAVSGGTWASSNTAVGTIGMVTGIISGISAGTTLVSYTLPSGCIASIVVTVNSLGPIGGLPSVCEGSTITLTDGTAGGIWTSSNNSTATVGSSTGVVTGVHSGTDIISYSYGPSCVVIKSISVDPSTPILGDLNICLGLTTTLTDSTVGGTWSSSTPLIASITSASISGGFATVVITGVTTGTATITYTLPTGCIQTAVVTVNVTAPISGMDSVCVGLTTALTDATAGVTWSSSNGAIATVGSSTGVVTGVAQGTVTITATSPLGCIATVVVTVNPNPAPILGSPVVCVGLTTSLSDVTSSGTWSSSDITIATVDATGVVTGVSAGTAIITYTLPTTCIATVVVTVDALPAPISGPMVVCVNSGIVLTDATSGGTWSASNSNATIGSASGIAFGVSAGLDTVTYTIGTGCIVTAVITINPLPSAIFGNPNVCLGSTNVFVNDSLGGTWSTSDTTILLSSSGAVGNVTGLVLGTATITYTLPTGCYTSLPISIDPNPLAITGTDSVCVGSITSLSDPTFGGTWSSSDITVATVGSGTGIVTGVNGGVIGRTVTITYTLGTGCYATYAVTVHPLPDSISGNFNVCIGTNNTLTDATAGGTWSSSNTAVGSIGSTTGIIHGTTLGTTTITYTLSTGCYVTQQVTVDPLPLPITGIDSVCVGSTTSLTDATVGGTWISSQIDTATVGNTTGIVTGVSSGTVTITYQLTATGCIATSTVTVHPLPAIITGNSSLCIGISHTLTDGTTGGTWSISDTTIATIVDTTGTYTGVAAGTATVTYTLRTGCYVTFPITVFPLPGPITGPSTVCVNSSITLSDSTVGGTWSSSLVDTANFFNPAVGFLTGIHSGTVIVTYTSNLSCNAFKVITVNPIPTPIYGGNSVCNGLTIQLHDTTTIGNVWKWSTTDSAISIVTGTGLVTGVSPGVDSILYTDTITGCRAVVNFTVNPIPVITATSTNNQQICIGGSVDLSASGAGPLGTYAWAPPAGLSATTGGGPGQAPIVATPTVTTTYTVIGTTQYGCFSDTTIIVHVDSLLRFIHVTGKDSICYGEVDTLIASPRYLGAPFFTWSPVSVSNVHGDTVTTTIDATTTYTVSLTDSFGCTYATHFTVTVNPLPNISVLPDPGIVCRGSSTPLTASGASIYTWFPNAFLSCDTCYNPIASDTQNLVYKVYGTSIYGCRDSILYPISVLDTTKLTISNDTVLCLGQCANLLTTSISVDGSHAVSYTWFPATGLDNSQIPNPRACPDTTTNYSVSIKENACFTDTQHVTVFVEPYPVITTTQSVTVAAGQAVQLGATISNDVLLNDYEWTPSIGLSCQKCYNPIAIPSVTTTYTFTATSNYGCVSNSDVTIKLVCDQLQQVFIPNTFTPNGDGVNDRFYISGTGIGNIIKLSIYNRWGELVFESQNTQANDAGAGWDGTYKGVVLEPDVFMYVVQMTCELGGQPFNFKGDVSIVR